MIDTEELTKFEHNGFACIITPRPDMCYGYTVYGYREADGYLFLPKILFDRDVSMSQIKKDCIDIMDGKFQGDLESVGKHVVRYAL